MNTFSYIVCAQCGLYHEAVQSPSTDKRLRFTRYTLAELAAVHGEGNFSVSTTRLLACPSGRGHVRTLADALQHAFETGCDSQTVKKRIAEWFAEHTDERITIKARKAA